MSEIQHILREFLKDTSYRSPQTPRNPTLREAVTAEIVSWNTGLGGDFVTGLSETSAVIAECAYAHVSYEHQLLIAIVTALVVYADDVGQHNVEAVGGFVQRFSAGERQLDPVFDRLADILRSLDDLYPRISADAIITSTLEYFTGTYIELTTKDEVISPAAVRYPHYLRLRTGLPSAYANMNFTKAWAEASGAYYLQVLPELEFIINGANISFYKETLAGETDNYIHLRAATERKSPIVVLRALVREVLDSLRNIQELSSAQPAFNHICSTFVMGYVEFHLNDPRYRLKELLEI
ncbi:terpenoid synthase [Earliella scabrosa]|nr:terpenoid synthase [Earliella scabrosa]